MTEIQEGDVFDLLDSLVAKSLVVTENVDGQMRYRLFESVRQYGIERVQSTGTEDALRDRHRDHFVALAETASTHFGGPEQKAWLDRLEAEHDNLRAALAWCLASPEGAGPGLGLAGSLWKFWMGRGHWREGVGHLERALAADSVPEPTGARATALRGAGALATSLGDYAGARERFEESLAIFRSLGDASGAAHVTQSLGFVARSQGDYESAESLHRQCLHMFEGLGDESGIAWTHLQLGYVASDRGDVESAWEHFGKAVAAFSSLGDLRGEANALLAMVTVLRIKGDTGAAEERLKRAREVFEELRDSRGLAWTLLSRGCLSALKQDLANAKRDLGESLRTLADLGDRDGIAYALEGLATSALGHDLLVAARFWGAAEALREEIGAPLPVAERSGQESLVAKARMLLGNGAFEGAWQVGREMEWESAVATALAYCAVPTLEPTIGPS